MKITKIEPYTPKDGEDKISVFDIGVADTRLYAANGVIVSNSKRIALLDTNALLSHHAVETLRDVATTRSQKNDDYWLQFMSGHTPVAPKVPLVYEQFMARLKGAGIHPVREGYQTHLMALTEKDIDQMAGNRVINSGETVDFDDELTPRPGGLFDPKLTGGHGGRQWSRIKLNEPLPSPAMEEPIRRLLDLTQKQYEGVLSGQQEIAGIGTGPQAVGKALDRINLPREIAAARMQMNSARGAAKDKAIRRLGYLKSAQKLGIHPRDWMLKSVPVLPPIFRPVSVLGDSGVPLVSDINYLYKELIDANENLAQVKEAVGKDNIGDERLVVYNSFKAITGLGDPVHPKLKEKKVTGLLRSVWGHSPKTGTVQRKLISRTVDNVGRGVIVPNPDLDMDSIGIPEEQAFSVYSRFITRRLVRNGLPLREALRAVVDKTPVAKKALLEEMEARPVFANRAPVLHKFGIMAFRPRLSAGSAIELSPLVVKGFNADFDGDAMQFHVPTAKEAVEEAYDKLLPSRSVLSPADMKSPVNVPGQQYQAGLYYATRKTDNSKKTPRTFRNRQDALGAYERGDIRADTPVIILGED